MILKFKLFYDDLKLEAQEHLCRALQTTPEKENWDIITLVVIERKEE